MKELEPERYELSAAPAYDFELERRQLFQALGGGLVILSLVKGANAQESGRGRRPGGRLPQEIGAWLHIGEDGAVTVYTGKVEVGQNTRTSLTQAVADELRVPVASVRLVMADTDLTPFDAGTFGSQSTPVMAPQLRRVAATARELLLDMAAETSKLERATLVAAGGKITHPPSNRSWEFGQLTRGQKLMQAVTATAPTTPAERWTVAGRSVPKVNGRDFVTGQHKFTSDVSLPGMLYGKVLRPPAAGAKLSSVDRREAEAISGVVVVRDGDFTGVTAASDATATRALAAMRAEWHTTPQPSAAELFTFLKQNQAERAGGGGGGRHAAGSIEQGLAAADHKLERTYTVAYIAHAPLEPRAAVAEWKDDKLTVWTGTQRPFGVRGELAEAFRIPEAQVRVIVPDTGSGYGGKHTGEAAVEAARLARSAGKPVKLVWTREEEFTHAYFRPAGVIEVSSGVRRDGALLAWDFHNYNSGASAIRTLYDVPNQRIEFHGTRTPLRQGSYRGLAATANHFARECHMDELAHIVNMDPLAFRLANLKDARLRAVLEAAAKAFGWSGRKKSSPRHGFGIAGGFEKGSYVATCAEVEVERPGGKVRIVRVVASFECGAVVNPEHLRNQIEGSVVQGIGGALFEAVDFADGKILNPRFSSYRVPRFSDTPPIETVLVDRKDLPSLGAGETPIVGIAPALGNAIFDATGVRLRSLPLAPDGVKS